jgi:hypothetical protein
MTCGIGVKPSPNISARTSIMDTYFLSVLDVPAPMPLPSLVRPTLNSRKEYLPERIKRKSGMVSRLGVTPLGVLTNLVGATYNLRLHSATMPVPLHLLTSLVSTTVSTRTTKHTLRQVVRAGSSKLFSVDTNTLNHARSGVSCLCLISKGRGNYVPLCLSMRCFPQIGNRVRRSEHSRSLNLRPLPRVVNSITTGESDDTTTGLFQDVLKLTQLRLWSACDRENHRTVYPPLSPVIITKSTQTFAGA